MAKAVTFQPTVRPDWCGVLSYLSAEEKADILEAIIRYPSKECKSAFWLETVKPDLDLQFETFVNRCEKNKQCINARWERIKSNTQDKKENTNEYARIKSYSNEYVLKDESEDKSKVESINKNINLNSGNTRAQEEEPDDTITIEEWLRDHPEGFKNEEKPKKKLTPPTLSEVEAYITEKKLDVDGQKFFDYFTEGKWKDSEGKPVKNWKQKLITWDNLSRQKRTLKAARGLFAGVKSGTYSEDVPL